MEKMCHRNAMGFVVNHVNGQVEYFEDSGAGENEEKQRFEQLQVPRTTKDEGWKVDVGR